LSTYRENNCPSVIFKVATKSLTKIFSSCAKTCRVSTASKRDNNAHIPNKQKGSIKKVRHVAPCIKATQTKAANYETYIVSRLKILKRKRKYKGETSEKRHVSEGNLILALALSP
jgi:hypothetical protein